MLFERRWLLYDPLEEYNYHAYFLEVQHMQVCIAGPTTLQCMGAILLNNLGQKQHRGSLLYQRPPEIVCNMQGQSQGANQYVTPCMWVASLKNLAFMLTTTSSVLIILAAWMRKSQLLSPPNASLMSSEEEGHSSLITTPVQHAAIRSCQKYILALARTVGEWMANGLKNTLLLCLCTAHAVV